MHKKIFIIENDVNVLYSLQAKLNIKGFITNIDFGNNRMDRIISKIIKFKPDYLIQELVLSKIDGFTIIKVLKENEATKNLPIFIFSNLNDKDSKAKSLNLDIKYYFIKNDFNIDEFVEKFVNITKNLEKNSIYKLS